MNSSTTPDELIEAARLAVRAAEPAAFIVEGRVVRRVIREHHNLPRYAYSVPHSRCIVTHRERLHGLVHPDELGLESEDAIPHQVVLLASPTERQLLQMSLPNLMLRTWRLLFHARIDKTVQDAIDSNALTIADIHARIDAVGQVEFDEIVAVLNHEHMLVEPNQRAAAWVEFVAMYLEFRYFAPEWLATWFPSLRDLKRIDELLERDVPARELFESSRPHGTPNPQIEKPPSPELPPPGPLDGQPLSTTRSPHARRHSRLTARAHRASLRGNSVTAAIMHLRASRFGEDAQVTDAGADALSEVDRLVRRLQDALDFDDDDARNWRRAIVVLLRYSPTGFWNADRRLLYDLQKVCIDHEREMYTIDLVKWIVSLGRRPIKRPLPRMREVQMSKHLRSAAGRLPLVRLQGEDRIRMAKLLRHAADLAEHQMRVRLRRPLHRVLDEVGMQPTNLPECVGRDGLVEEALDCVAERGYLTMGYLRDAISRNHLKLPDLSRIRELVKGDRLLRADDRLEVELDGVYHRGEFYLRWLQVVSSLAFGTRVGRFTTQFIAIPFGGAFLIVEGLVHLAHMAAGHAAGATAAGTIDPATGHVAGSVVTAATTLAAAPQAAAGSPVAQNLISVLALGFLLMAVIHVDEFRHLLSQFAVKAFRILKLTVIDLPLRLLRTPWMRWFMRSPPVVLFRRYVLWPAGITGFFFVLIPRLYHRDPPSARMLGTIYVLTSLAFNSRLGRDIEELTFEWISTRWNELRARVFVALYDWVMETFELILNNVERFLYAVDEWLRFKSGETTFSLCLKAVLGVGWSLFMFAVRIYLNLLIEPQINPIKHFPVVTVSHKIMLPLTIAVHPTLVATMTPFVGSVFANFAVGTTLFLFPGVFGFLVWELKENWRLYEANRQPGLRPIIVGSHGETLSRLLKPGFHSGTLAKLFRRLRRLEIKEPSFRRTQLINAIHERLRHVEVSVRHFLERELTMYLDESPAWTLPTPRAGRIQVAPNNIIAELMLPNSPSPETSAPMVVAFQEQSGRLIASLLHVGWIEQLDDVHQVILANALGGLYKVGDVDIVREQVESAFIGRMPPYDISDHGLVVWPDGHYNIEITYDLERRPALRPSPPTVALSFNLPTLNAEDRLFRESDVSWIRWVTFWESSADTISRDRIPVCRGVDSFLNGSDRTTRREEVIQSTLAMRSDR